MDHPCMEVGLKPWTLIPEELGRPAGDRGLDGAMLEEVLPPSVLALASWLLLDVTMLAWREV